MVDALIINTCCIMFELPSAEYHTLTTFIVTNTNGTVHNVHPEASVQESVSQLGTLPLCRRPFDEESASATRPSLTLPPLSPPNTLRTFACRGSVIEKTFPQNKHFNQGDRPGLANVPSQGALLCDKPRERRGFFR